MIDSDFLDIFLSNEKCNIDSTALRFKNQSITYRELWLQIKKNQIYLQNKLKHHEVNIGLCLYKNINCISWILTVFSMGLTCIPINSTWPKNRIKTILEETNIDTLLTDDIEMSFISKLVKSDVVLINTDEINKLEEKPSYQTHLKKLKPNFNRAAYMLYTSGTSGQPKGVKVSYFNLISIRKAWEKYFHLSQQTQIHLQLAHYTFDVFFGDVLRSLPFGHELVLCDKKTMLTPSNLYKLINQADITFAEFTPFILRRLIGYCEELSLSLSTFNTLICGSDLWTIHEYRKFKATLGINTQLVNTYGLTEATIDSTAFKINNLNEFDIYKNEDLVPIGRPLPGVDVLLLDESQNIINKPYEAGEIYIFGPTLSQGYMKDKDNQDKFVNITVDGKSIKSLKTGDYAHYMPDGQIMLLGRKDSQVKLHGKRIELASIESKLNDHPLIETSMVTLINPYHQPELVAYIKLKYGEKMSEFDARKFLYASSNDIVLPSKFYSVKEIPINSNGKLIRKPLNGERLPRHTQTLKHLNTKTV